MPKKKISWSSVIIGLFIAISAVVIYVLYQSGDLSERIPVPRIVWVIYEFLGIEVGALVQFILGAIITFFGFKQEK